MTPHAHVREAKLILGIMAHFRCSHLVHDFTGAGSAHETIIKMAGMPLDRIIPVVLQPACKGNIFQFKGPTKFQPRWVYTCDKPRSITVTCELIKNGILKFFRYDHHGSEDEGLLHDFLHLIEDKSDKGGIDTYKILHDPSGPDDFAMAVNIGTMCICQMSKLWPNVAQYAGVEMSEEAINAMFPISIKHWDDMP
jgi:hypothetical protein